MTEQNQDVIQATTEDESESIDPEATLYLKELTEDWANILVKPKSYRPVRNIIVNKTQNDEIWIQTTCNNSEKIEWLADTGSPRSFINQSTAKKLMSNNRNIIIERYNENKRYKCFNNKEIKIKGVIHMDITSGNWIAKKCQILIVEQNTTNLMGRDMLPKLGISLQQTKQQGRQIRHISDIETEKNYYQMDIQKLSTLMYTSRQIQKSHSKVIIPGEPQPQSTKRKKDPLTPNRKGRKRIRQTDKR